MPLSLLFILLLDNVSKVQICPIYFIAQHLPVFSYLYRIYSKFFNMAFRIPSLPHPLIIFLVSISTTLQIFMILPSSIKGCLNTCLHTMPFYSSVPIHVLSSLPGRYLLLLLYLSNSYSPFLILFRCHLYEIFLDVLRLISPLFCISKTNSASLFTSVFKLDFNGLSPYLPLLLNH